MKLLTTAVIRDGTASQLGSWITSDTRVTEFPKSVLIAPTEKL